MRAVATSMRDLESAERPSDSELYIKKWKLMKQIIILLGMRSMPEYSTDYSFNQRVSIDRALFYERYRLVIFARFLIFHARASWEP